MKSARLRGAEADLTSTYEVAVTAADTLADSRFDNAQAAAQIALTSRQIAEQQELLEGLREERCPCRRKPHLRKSAWKGMWAGASLNRSCRI